MASAARIASIAGMAGRGSSRIIGDEDCKSSPFETVGMAICVHHGSAGAREAGTSVYREFDLHCYAPTLISIGNTIIVGMMAILMACVWCSRHVHVGSTRTMRWIQNLDERCAQVKAICCCYGLSGPDII